MYVVLTLNYSTPSVPIQKKTNVVIARLRMYVTEEKSQTAVVYLFPYF